MQNAPRVASQTDEESPAQLRERFVKVYTERNTLLKDVDTLTRRLQSEESTRRSQLKRIEKLELELAQFETLQKQGVPKRLRQLEVDFKAQQSTSTRVLPECARGVSRASTHTFTCVSASLPPTLPHIRTYDIRVDLNEQLKEALNSCLHEGAPAN